MIDRLEPRQLFSSFVVSTTADSGAGSLRQAILDSNALAGADTIGFTSTFNTAHTISLILPLPQISSPLSIVGTGSSVLAIHLGTTSTPVSGIFSSTAATLSLSGMTITGANISGGGGGLQSTGPGQKDVTIDDCIFTGNTAAAMGGAIFLNNNTTLTIRNSTITGNTSNVGGGICFVDNGSLVMQNCTISNNTATASAAEGGGGLYFFGTALTTVPAGYTAGTLVINGSTFSGNTTGRDGGGIMVDTFTGTLDVQNSTISGNTAATSGGGITAEGLTGNLLLQNSTIFGNTAYGTGTLGGGGIFRTSTMHNAITLTNTIVSGNTNAGSPDIRVDTFTTTTANFSAIGNATGFTLAADSGNNLAFGANPLLRALANNGGTTQTLAIGAGSPLINAGSSASTPAALTTDQRGTGFPRVIGAQVDIGAYERAAAAAAPVLLESGFFFDTAPQSIRYAFDSNVSASLSTADLQVQNLTTGTTLPASSFTLAYNSGSNSATFLVNTPSSGILAQANYRATLFAAGVTNAAGTPLASNNVLNFFVLPGDANHDRSVNFSDLVILAQNYGQTGRTFSQGNFDYSADGKVDFNDLVIFAQHYNMTLPASIVSPIVTGDDAKRHPTARLTELE